MRAVLGQAFALLVAHANLFTLISLTVWLPAHVLKSYLEFFGPAEAGAGQLLRAMLTVQVVFDPLVVSATLAALGRIAQGLPVSYGIAMSEGLRAWGRLLLVRFVINLAIALPALGALLAAPLQGAAAIAAGALCLVLAVGVGVLLVRFALVDSVVVLERGTLRSAWRRAATLTAGQRWSIVGTLLALFVIFLSFAVVAAWVFRAVPELNHFVPRVLLDCMVAVGQSLFTIALFLFYRRARAREHAAAAIALSSA